MTYCSIALLQKGNQHGRRGGGGGGRNKMVNSIFKRLYPSSPLCLTNSGPVVSRDPNDKLVSSSPYANLSLLWYTRRRSGPINCTEHNFLITNQCFLFMSTYLPLRRYSHPNHRPIKISSGPGMNETHRRVIVDTIATDDNFPQSDDPNDTTRCWEHEF